MTHANKNITADLFEPAPIVHLTDVELSDAPQLSFWKDAWIRLRKNKGAVLSIVLLVLIAAMAFLGPLMNDHSYKDQNLTMICRLK